ncbi:hypothetical protein DFQ01_10193 [Paenibacillus cellulosilyticus]|uniref:CARDB protein n=1 Tax=Paenibacillus cellulosilyticus TaxID=375489 RepID=A0A2V2Z0R4_9BACL|nr:hypothetical protein [Paenibacillus cellulosilyticus]PWW08372.1 hypothetical protein DFQ01_10193 [Paenibacillus cellulosilyticus]QKS47967.1 hypothetical protein HUB94_27110 [Paenibacillus cellulosilyticus]
MRKIVKHSITAAAAFALLANPIQSILPWSQSAVAQAATTSISSKAVKLNSSSTIAVRDVQLLMQDQGLVLAYTVTVTNDGNSKLDLQDYFMRLKGKSGKVFKANTSSSDKSITEVAPKSSVNITYYAIVDRTTQISDITFDIIAWDFSQPNYQRSVGTIKFPAGQTEKTAAYQPKTILFGSNSKVKGALKQYYVTQDQNGGYVTISFLLENVGSSSVDASKLNFALQTASYSVYDVSADLSGVTLQPGQRKIVTFTSQVPLAVLGKSVNLISYTKDETNNVSLANGAFVIPALKASSAVGVGSTRAVFMDGRSISTSASTGFLTTSDDTTDITMDFTLKNIDAAAIALPDLEFFIRTKSGVEYPLSYTKADGDKLLPGIEKVLNLSGTIEESVDPNTSKLIVRVADGETTSGYVIGTYMINGATQQGAVGSVYTYDTSYQVKLSTLERAPQADNDQLIAQLEVTNISSTSKATPNLSGYFLVNGVKVTAEAKAVPLDDTINIASKGKYRFVVYSEIPYTTALDNVTFVLTAPVEGKTAKTLYTFNSSSISSIPTYNQNQEYVIDRVGHQTSITLLKSNIYKSSTASYFYSEFVAVNNEERNALIGNIGAYIKDDKGTIIPIEVSQMKEKVLPDGKVLISAWGKLNKTFNVSNYQLIIGQAITDSSTSTSGTTATESTIVVNPVAYKLSGTQASATLTTLKNIPIANYTFSMSSVYNTLSVSGSAVNGVKLDFDYDLVDSDEYDSVAAEHNLMFEFVDHEMSNATYTKTYTLDKEGDGTTPGLPSGTALHATVTFSDSEILEKIQQFNTYTVNIYDVIDDAKVLLATKDFTWYEKE